MSEKNLRERVAERLIGLSSQVPVGKFRRLSRSAFGAAQARKLLSSKGDIDEEALVKWVTSLGEMKGIAMKVGQIMSYVDVALPPQVREALGALQTHSPSMPFEEVTRIVKEELGAEAGALLATMDETPIAAASIGQVHRATLPDGTQVAVKVQYPGIERAMEDDFGFAAVGPKIAGVLFPHAAVGSIFAEVRERLLEECDYIHEAASQERFGALFQDHPTLAVPEVHTRWCSRRVLTTTFAEGMSLREFLATNPSQETRNTLGLALFEFYVGSFFLHRIFNCDPHPGNYLISAEGTLTVLDYGSCREFSPAFVERAGALTLAVQSDTREELHQAFVDLGMVDDVRPYKFETARELVRSFYGPMLENRTQHVDLGPGIGMRQAYERKKEMLQLTLPPEFVFLFRIRFGLFSVLAELGCEANWAELERELLSR